MTVVLKTRMEKAFVKPWWLVTTRIRRDEDYERKIQIGFHSLHLPLSAQPEMGGAGKEETQSRLDKWLPEERREALIHRERPKIALLLQEYYIIKAVIKTIKNMKNLTYELA